MSEARVILIANDVVPGMGLAVAAPGLRAYGLGIGLRAHGCEVLTVVDQAPLRSLRPAGGLPALPEETVVLEGDAIGEFVAARAQRQGRVVKSPSRLLELAETLDQNGLYTPTEKPMGIRIASVKGGSVDLASNRFQREWTFDEGQS